MERTSGEEIVTASLLAQLLENFERSQSLFERDLSMFEAKLKVTDVAEHDLWMTQDVPPPEAIAYGLCGFTPSLDSPPEVAEKWKKMFNECRPRLFNSLTGHFDDAYQAQHDYQQAVMMASAMRDTFSEEMRKQYCVMAANVFERVLSRWQAFVNAYNEYELQWRVLRPPHGLSYERLPGSFAGGDYPIDNRGVVRFAFSFERDAKTITLIPPKQHRRVSNSSVTKRKASVNITRRR
jgi:hypothetical protein